MEQSTERDHPGVRTARRALSRPHAARLVIDGNGPDGAHPTQGAPVEGVELIDRHGTPVLVCDPDSALAQASRDRRTATLTLVGPDTGSAPQPVVVMRGRLSPLSADRIEERDVELVELVLTGLEVDGQEVAVAAYVEEPADLLERYVGEVLAHANRDHGAQLRGFAASVGGTSADEIAAARLAQLDPLGVTVAWIDLAGGYEVRVLFPSRAGTRRQLAAHLAQALCVHEDACGE